MLKVSDDIQGPNLFNILFHEVDPARANQLLDVNDVTLRRWRNGTAHVPRMAVLALFWESKYGRSLIDTDQVNEIRILYRRIHLLEAQYAKAKEIVAGLRKLHTGTANEAYFDDLMAMEKLPLNTYSAMRQPLPDGMGPEDNEVVKIAAGQSR